MRLGIFGDVHGDIRELEAVLARFKREGVTEYLCLGDVVNLFQHTGGQRNTECVARVDSMQCPVMRGNHDWAYSKDPRADPAIRQRLRDYPLTYQSIDCRILAAHATWRDPKVSWFVPDENTFEDELQSVGMDVRDLQLLLLGHRHTPVLLRGEREGKDVVVMLGDPLAEGSETQFRLDVRHYRYLLVPGAVCCPHSEEMRGYGAVYDGGSNVLLMFRERL